MRVTHRLKMWIRQNPKTKITIFCLIFVVFGIVTFRLRAAAPTFNIQAENATVVAPAQKLADATASSGQAIRFGDGSSSTWPDQFNYLKQSGGISRTINGVVHTLPNAIIGPVPGNLFNTYNGPKDWQGYPVIGDPYIDSLNFYALASCETGTPGGDPRGYAPDDLDAGGERFGAFQFAKGTWHYAVDLHNNEAGDPYQDPRDAPMWYQVMRSKRLMLKELIRGPGQAWRYPPETHHMSCGERLFTGNRPSAERIQ